MRLHISHKIYFNFFTILGYKGQEGEIGDRGKIGKDGPVGHSGNIFLSLWNINICLKIYPSNIELGEKGSKGAPGYAAPDGSHGVKGEMGEDGKFCFSKPYLKTIRTRQYFQTTFSVRKRIVVPYMKFVWITYI